MAKTPGGLGSGKEMGAGLGTEEKLKGIKHGGKDPFAGREDPNPKTREARLGNKAPEFYKGKRGRGRWGATEGGEGCKIKGSYD